VHIWGDFSLHNYIDEKINICTLHSVSVIQTLYLCTWGVLLINWIGTVTKMWKVYLNRSSVLIDTCSFILILYNLIYCTDPKYNANYRVFRCSHLSPQREPRPPDHVPRPLDWLPAAVADGGGLQLRPAAPPPLPPPGGRPPMRLMHQPRPVLLRPQLPGLPCHHQVKRDEAGTQIWD
jgi:hypothetical protein